MRLAAVAAALVLAGCGEEEKRLLDVGEVERGIARGVERDRPGTKVASVDCPDEVELRKGGVFRCRVTSSKPREVAVATVTQEDDQGRVRYEIP